MVAFIDVLAFQLTLEIFLSFPSSTLNIKFIHLSDHFFFISCGSYGLKISILFRLPFFPYVRCLRVNDKTQAEHMGRSAVVVKTFFVCICARTSAHPSYRNKL